MSYLKSILTYSTSLWSLIWCLILKLVSVYCSRGLRHSVNGRIQDLNEIKDTQKYTYAWKYKNVSCCWFSFLYPLKSIHTSRTFFKDQLRLYTFSATETMPLFSQQISYHGIQNRMFFFSYTIYISFYRTMLCFDPKRLKD